MEFIDTVLKVTFNSGIFIPAIMIGYYLAYRSFSAFIIPCLIFALVDHFLVQTLYIIDIQQNAFVQMGAKLSQINWGDILLRDIFEHIVAFFIISLVFSLLIKLYRKLKK